MQVKTNVKGGGTQMQHNEAQVRATAQELRVQSSVKAGATPCQDPGSGVKGLKVQSGVKAGAIKFTDLLVSG
jgi:hypothetical protein